MKLLLSAGLLLTLGACVPPQQTCCVQTYAYDVEYYRPYYRQYRRNPHYYRRNPAIYVEEVRPVYYYYNPPLY